MDQDMLKLLAQFRILLKKEKNIAVDFEKLLADPAYARHVVGCAEDTENELLLTLAIGLREKLGLLRGAEAVKAVAPVAAARVDSQKYKFGARS